MEGQKREVLEQDDEFEEFDFERRLRLLEHADQRAEVLPTHRSSELTGRGVRFMRHDCVGNDPERVTLSRERAGRLDVVEENGVSLVEDSRRRQARSAQKETAC